MTAVLRERDDHFDDHQDADATLELTSLALEVNDPETGLVFYFSRSGGGDQKIITFAQNLIAEVIKTGSTK